MEIAYLKTILEYEPLSGDFIWKVSRGRQRKGNTAGKICKNGYVQIGIDKKHYPAHRLAWLFIHGRWPRDQIDHINRVRHDNRLSNLREATGRENQYNTGLRSNNTSGLKGVRWSGKQRKWIAYIRADGKLLHLGSFSSKELAHQTYIAVAKEKHGKFMKGQQHDK